MKLQGVLKVDRRGFTLVELFIVIGVTLVLVGAVASPIYNNLQITGQLNESTSRIIQTLRTAREYSAARFNNAAHGVYFEINVSGDDRVILYQGATYATRDISYDRIFVLDSALSLLTTITGDEVNFSKGLGLPNNTGTITLTHAVSGTRSVILNSFGVAQGN